MAVDTRAKRFSMMNMGTTGAFRGPLTPDGSNMEAGQRAHLIDLYAGFALGGGGGSFDGGTVALFLDDVTPVPATARYIHGAAYAQTGERYVCAWPANDAVHYIGPFAHRSDGALIILPEGGTIVRRNQGVSTNYRGEVFYSTGPATYFIQGEFLFGWRLNALGSMCFTGP